MATNAQWLATAKALYSGPFSDQTKNTIVLTSVTANYDTQTLSTSATDTITLARVYDVSLNKINGTNVQTNDRMIGIINENLNVDPRADNTNCTVNGVEVSIESVSIDEAGAVYTLQVRNK